MHVLKSVGKYTLLIYMYGEDNVMKIILIYLLFVETINVKIVINHVNNVKGLTMMIV